MRIIAVDDEKLALDGLLTEISLAAPDAEIQGFRSGKDAIEFCRKLRDDIQRTDVDETLENIDGVPSSIDVAFLDIEMRGMSGLSLGEKLLSIFPKINLIYTTGYSEYAVEAISLRCSGYILKPVTEAKIKHELSNLRNPVESKKKKLYIKTFGRFEAYQGGRPLKFRYQKTRELLAYLVDRRGELVANADIVSVLWEDDSPDSSHISYLKNIRTDLIKTLEESGCMECIIRSRGEIGILTDAVDCDYYDFLEGNAKDKDIRSFNGEYMSQYSWGEYTLASLMKKRGDMD